MEGFHYLRVVVCYPYVLGIDWNRIDTLIASFIFTQSEIAAQTTWMNIVMIVDCFVYGLSVAIGSKISFFIVKDEIHNAKKTAFVANGTCFGFGIILGLILYFCSEGIAS